MVRKPDEGLQDALKQLRLSGDYSDMTIICGDDLYHAHKALLCPRSKYFERTFKSEMQESHSSQVDLSGHNPEAVKLVIDFFYLSDYKPSHGDQAHESEIKSESPATEIPAEATIESQQITDVPEDVNLNFASGSKKNKKKKSKTRNGSILELMDERDRNPDLEPSNLAESLREKTFLLTHCYVYALAEYLQVNELKVLAASKFRGEAEKHWNHPDFFEAVQEVYRTSVRNDRLLRDIVVEVMKKHGDLLNRFEYQDVVSQLDLSFELLMAVKTEGWG
ncbi:uncharacterized protein PpBr36_09905 [Pyricularia pennisetigena]|uniref:uncharacterized protein n=1 Tax=Pyricularia pennisetigena TaxID=1578925 RepID=UPI001153BEE5|nr:uncharacterized protein PpBr36_09905 [Pyricularia pennisetigena]TLS22468.1 hypothetical protein PpBr36_09905 [Pyricularia pennisetigena]